jgi:pimeloyl-ACP methyl ester carboxylesterase
MITGELPIHGHRIAYLDRGHGPTLLFLHGNPDSHALWNGVIERLEARFRCIAPDLPGFGASTLDPAFDFSLESMAAFVEEFVERLGLEEPVGLVVHDFGGPYGLSWAVEHPERLRGVLITNSLFFAGYRWHFWARVWRTPWLGELSMLLMGRWLFHFEVKRGSRKLSREHIEALWRQIDPAKKRMVLRLYRAADPAGFAGWEERFHGLARTLPVRVLWGKRDPYIPPRWAHGFGTTDVHFYSESGHWLPAEESGAVALHLERLFADTPHERPA